MFRKYSKSFHFSEITGKKKYADYQSRIDELLPWLEEKRTQLLDDIKKDADAFYPLSQAYSISKDQPDRDEIMENALLVAAKAPLEIMEDVYELVPILEELKELMIFISGHLMELIQS